MVKNRTIKIGKRDNDMKLKEILKAVGGALGMDVEEKVALEVFHPQRPENYAVLYIKKDQVPAFAEHVGQSYLNGKISDSYTMYSEPDVALDYASGAIRETHSVTLRDGTKKPVVFPMPAPAVSLAMR
jgi:hypothetical protein